MNRIFLSIPEKKIVRVLSIVVFIQLMIILLFCRIWNESQTIDLKNTIQRNITVEEIYITRVISEYRLVIYSDSQKYLVASSTTAADYSVSKLYESISIGDELSIIYYEKNSIFNKNNIILDARSETETYRSYEEYKKGKMGLLFAVIIMFIVVELFFCGIIFVFIWLEQNIIKGLYRKIKKCFT